MSPKPPTAGQQPRHRQAALINELGQRQTPPVGTQYFQVLGRGQKMLFIGPGPDPEIAVQLLRELASSRKITFDEVYWTDSQDFRRGLHQDSGSGLPPAWLEWSEHEAQQAFATPEDWTFALYLPGLRLFPSWYGPLFGRAWAASAGRGPGANLTGGRDIRRVTLAGSERDLLHRELRLTLEGLGLEVLAWDCAAQNCGTPVAGGFFTPPEDKLGDLFLSVNFRGLDAFGAVYQYLRARGLAVAVWCVDNPWHLLTGLRAPYWMELPLFVTDDSFIAGLSAHGARKVHHLPLAVCPELMRPDAADSAPDFTANLASLVFVGRTAFPERDKFFAAQRLEPDLFAQAVQDLRQGQRLEFLHWARRLGLQSLWPGQEVRQAGLAAETCARAWRRLCVSAGLEPDGPGVTIFGDAGWEKELAEAAPPERAPDLRAPLDYYTQLPRLYASARLILNATSLLLPAGLNQRHFDVWMAGGALLSDNSPGLKIFPQDLTAPIVFDKPADIPRRAAGLLEDGARLEQLKNDWRHLLGTEHTYAQRLQTLLEIVCK